MIMESWFFILYFFIIFKKTGLCQVPLPDAQYNIQTNQLPDDMNFMPTLGNGHLGYTVFGDSIFMNGIYNGEAGNSRRARIPNWINITAYFEKYQNDITYRLDLKNGYFQWEQTTHGKELQIIQRTYAHRFFNRVLVYNLQVIRKHSNEPIKIEINQMPGANSSAFDFKSMSYETSNSYIVLKGTTKSVENVDFQILPKTIYIVFSEDLTKTKTFYMPPDQDRMSYTFLITIDESLAGALKDMQDAFAMNEKNLLSLHTIEWQNFWKNFNIEIQGNSDLQLTINAGIFYLSNSLPSPSVNQPNHPYYGLSPTGLGRGNRDQDYEGHSFWDTEIWMMPIITQLNVNWSKDLFDYRYRNLAAAKFNAKKKGYRGACFPWESAYTGTEVINPCCPQIADQEIHISPDIVFAVMQFYITTFDIVWLCDQSLDTIENIVDFLIDRVTVDKMGKYHLENVIGPDEDHSNVTDNVYTNVITKYAFRIALRSAKICGKKVKGGKNSHWRTIAENLEILYDPILDYHPQHKDYIPGEPIKQADTILIGFPLQYPMKISTQMNDLTIYANVTRHSGPAMTWSMFAINNLIVGNTEKAKKYFFISYRDYVRPEFKVWSETRRGIQGSANFLTGIGGFLQTILNGYAGIRFNHNCDDGNELLPMELHKPTNLPDTTAFQINGIYFAGSKFNLKLTKNNDSILECTHVGRKSLYLIDGKTRFLLSEGFKYTFNNSLIRIGPG